MYLSILLECIWWKWIFMFYVFLFLDKFFFEKVLFILNLYGKWKGFLDYVKLLYLIIFVYVVSYVVNLGF